MVVEERPRFDGGLLVGVETSDSTVKLKLESPSLGSFHCNISPPWYAWLS